MSKNEVKFNSENKKVIRSAWAKPLLKYLHDTLDKKLIYLGLPDVEAHDINEWIELIDVVYAFQCRDYPNPSLPEQSRENVLALENTLRALERKQLLSTFDVFDGYIEEVLVRGYDNTPTIKEYYQQDTVTIYNLDFCGQVTSPIEYVDKNGKWKKAYKFNAVDKLLSFQKSIDFPSKKFVMFLTLHCSYDGQEYSNFVSNIPSDYEAYIRPVMGLPKGKKSAYLVKAFVYEQLTRFFTQNYFAPEFLPTIYYKGDNGHPLLFFTIIGTQVENGSGLPHPPEKIKTLLNTPFISVGTDGQFENNTELILENDVRLNGVINSLNLFKASKSHKKIWNNE